MSEVYVFNPLKKTVLGFDKQEDASLYLKLDPKQFGEKEEYKRKSINPEEKDKLLKEEKAVYHKMDKNYRALIDKLIENTENSPNDFIRFKREKMGSLGVIVELSKEQHKELKNIAAETLEKHTVSLNKDSSGKLSMDDLRTVTIAKMNGNYIPQKDDLKMESLMKRINVSMKFENFKKLNPDYNKFAILTNTKDRESQVFRFPSQQSRTQFMKNIRQAIQDEKKSNYKITEIGNFNSITTFKVCSSKDYVDMYKKGRELKDAKVILNHHANSVKQAVSKIQTTKVGQTKKQTQTKTKARSL